MAITININEVEELAPGIWESPLTPGEVRSLGKPMQELGSKSILMLTSEDYRFSDGSLNFDPAHIVVVNVGSDCCAIFLTVGQEKEIRIHIEDSPAKSTEGWGPGDQKFIRETQRQLDEELATVGRKLLGGIRKNLLGDLVEGKARKFVNFPDNVVAITIQPRDRSLAVHVKGDPEDFQPTPLEIKTDRSSYCRFKITAESQLEDALKVILSSARRHAKKYALALEDF